MSAPPGASKRDLVPLSVPPGAKSLPRGCVLSRRALSGCAASNCLLFAALSFLRSLAESSFAPRGALCPRFSGAAARELPPRLFHQGVKATIGCPPVMIWPLVGCARLLAWPVFICLPSTGLFQGGVPAGAWPNRELFLFPSRGSLCAVEWHKMKLVILKMTFAGLGHAPAPGSRVSGLCCYWLFSCSGV